MGKSGGEQGYGPVKVIEVDNSETEARHAHRRLRDRVEHGEDGGLLRPGTTDLP